MKTITQKACFLSILMSTLSISTAKADDQDELLRRIERLEQNQKALQQQLNEKDHQIQNLKDDSEPTASNSTALVEEEQLDDYYGSFIPAAVFASLIRPTDRLNSALTLIFAI